MLVYVLLAFMVACSCQKGKDVTSAPDPFPGTETFGDDADIQPDSESESLTNTDTCDASICNNPPRDHCHDTSCMRRYNSEGYCVDRECFYSYVIRCCRWGCEGYSCNPIPCHLIECNTPPPPECLDRGRLLKYEDWGECDEGYCFYEYEIIECNCQIDGADFYCIELEMEK